MTQDRAQAPLPDGATFDYVICGAGSAGCVLAARLSEDPSVSVLLLEAGHGDTPDMVSTPLRTIEIWHSDYDGQYEPAPQAHAGNRRIYWPRGKVLGGSSAMNGMIYVRGTPQDYDAWALQGCHGWDWDSLRPYFLKSEDFDKGANAHHGSGGPLHVTTRHARHPLYPALIEAAGQAGIAFNPDYNGARVDGISYIQFNARDGKRASSNAAFLDPARSRENLCVVTQARVSRLGLEDGRVEAVHVVSPSGESHVKVRREAVLSAGTLESPRILMLSGIGPAAHLREMAIDVAMDLPGVGQNLHDHTLLPMTYAMSEKYEFPTDPSVPPMQVHMFTRSRADIKVPDLQPLFFCVPAYAPGQTGPDRAVTFHAAGLRPTSRGQIRLTGKALSYPLALDPNLLATEYDVAALVASMKEIRTITAQPALAAWITGEVYPGPDVTDDAALAEYARSAVGSYHHQVGTCAMGQGAMAVVDPDLRVRGIRGLRVADASIIPTIMSGNTNAPAIMIGEKCADMMRASPH
ncbi:GMC family oxidoreductase [Phaeobacter sp. HF9A]|uniref:GMC family oxidoreductase n=1 Tax=Phaeobacter sp. HF9A TaxID=2721561 RepID=UPI00142F5FAE|nr:GMC family oxidoreductase N-terminal domain-containing protein [Phaeobacter sp. HF9A]NIZ13567.1 choline dehydrogenase [Phaeobacter sp. HF9A]